jgi:hypothetical protein
MEEVSSLPETVQVEYLTYKSKTYAIRVGCGNLYVTIDYNQNGSFHKIRIPRNTKFNCTLIARDSLAKQATFQIRREPKQLIKDLRGNKAHACKNYNITCKAYSCSDAIAKVVQKEIDEVSAKKV